MIEEFKYVARSDDRVSIEPKKFDIMFHHQKIAEKARKDCCQFKA
jgi:hypothetical protein